MRKVSQNAFHRVQRFSTDWHNNSFAGSIVRKITRGMWALDMINDVLLLAVLPSLVVLVGTVLLLGQRWPVMGVGDGARLDRLCDADGDARDSPHRARFASFQRAGHAHRWRACRRARRKCGGEILRCGSSRGCAARAGRRQMVTSDASHLDASHLQWYGATRVALVRSLGHHWDCACGCGGRDVRRPARSPMC